jgi:SAM-dependent methyltransferase
MELSTPEVEKLFNQGTIKDEFELIIDSKNMNMTKFITLLKYIGYRHSNDKLEIQRETSLDINLSDGPNMYRITIVGNDAIKSVVNNHYQKKNIQVFHSLLQEAKSGIGNYSIMNKTRKGIIDQPKYRCRLSRENVLDVNSIKLKEDDRHNITFRYKQRASLLVDTTESGKIKLDVTQVQQSTQLSLLMSAPIQYEAELDFSIEKKINANGNILQKIMGTLKSILGTLQSSNLIITQNDEVNVLNEYKKLVYNEKVNTHHDLYAMQSVSLELIPFTEIITNQYSVTDKADGERHFLFCTNNKAYLINNNLAVRQLDVKLENNFNNTILDGEVISLNNKQVFLAFDILFDRGVDLRSEINLTTRYLKVRSILSEMTHIKYDYLDIHIPDSFDMDDQLKMLGKNLDKHNNELNKCLKSDDKYVLFLKYFVFPTGGDKSEIFAYSNLMWTKYTTEYKLPYTLDGLIFTPLKQKYTRNKDDTKFRIYKWKPKEMNSLDLYIEFERDQKTKDIMIVFDNSNINLAETAEESILKESADEKDALYQVAKLYVGRINQDTNIEIPVPFKQKQELHLAHLFLKDGNVRDVEGNIIQDKTVVEFTYDTVNNREPKKRWIPLRTRYDKTEMVQKYKRKYGNSEKIADSIWQSMNFLIDMSDFKLLGNPETYTEHINLLRSKLTAKDIAIYRATDAYYMKKTNIAKAQRNFHNFVKSQYIYNYCSITQDRKLDIFDIGIGRGGDLNKYFLCKVKSITGIDADADGLFSAGSDSTIGRLAHAKKTLPNFPPTDLIHASFGAPLFDIEKQAGVLPNMAENSKRLLTKISNKKYDVVSAMFMLHYLFRDQESIDNMIDNFKILKPGGYFLACLFDGPIVHEALKEKKVIEEYYTTEDGQKELLFTIKPMYNLEDKNIDKPGVAISVFNTTYMDIGSEFIEYLVTPEFLIKTLKKANLELVETDTFQNVFTMSKDFLFDAINYDAGKATKKFLSDVKEYYNMDVSINKAGFEMTRLNRFYVFRKKE